MHRFLFHNVFFLVASLAISRSLALTLSVLFHFFEDMFTSRFGTLLYPYPLYLVDLGLDQSGLYSAQFKHRRCRRIPANSIASRGIANREEGVNDVAKFILMLFGSLSFGAPRLAEILDHISQLIVKMCRFTGVFLFLVRAFVFEKHAPPK